MIKSSIHWADLIEPDRIWKGCTLLKYRIFLDHDSKQLLLEFKSPTNPYCSFLEMIDYWVGNVYFPNKTSEFKPSYFGLSKLECLINDLND